MFPNPFLRRMLPLLLILFPSFKMMAAKPPVITAIDSTYIYKMEGEILHLNIKALYNVKHNACGVSVSYWLPEQAISQHGLTLFLDDMSPVKRTRDTIVNLKLSDAHGPVNFTVKTVNGTRVYTGTRPVWGKVNVAYQIPAAVAEGRYGPHIDMQESGGGLTGSFVSILMLPEIKGAFLASVNWQLKKGDQAISTLGVGDVQCENTIVRDELLYGQFILGKLFTFPKGNTNSGFSIAGLGLNKKQIGTSLDVYRKTYDYMLSRLNGSPKTAFRFFFRSFPGINKMSGSAAHVGRNGSFVVFIPEDGKLGTVDVYNLIAHEMIHVVVKNAEADWYNEGIADYLSTVLPHQAGLTSTADYVYSINQLMAQYYTNSVRLAPDSTYDALKWSTANAWTLSYSRGALYFANLDAKLNKIQGKHPTVLSLVQDMNADIRNASWERLLRQKVGEWAVTDYKDMLSGKLITPEPGAFGESVEIKKVGASIFDMGFLYPRNPNKGDKIRDLNPDSMAAKAGLQNGDEIMESVNLVFIYSSYDKPVTLKVKRDGKIMTFTYLPHGTPADTYLWFAR